MSGILCIMLFLEDQVYILEEDVIFQGNQSYMLVVKNTKYLCGKSTSHVYMRYFSHGQNRE